MEMLLIVAQIFDSRIEAEIKRLDSPVFQIREDAVKRIAAFGWRAIPMLKLKLDDSESLEVRNRCLKTISIIEHQSNSYWIIYPSNYPFQGFPKIGGLAAMEFRNAERLVLRYLKLANKNIMERKSHIDDPNREATAIFVKDMLVAGKSRREVQVIIDGLADKERTWWLLNHPDKMPSGYRAINKAKANRLPHP